MGFQIFLHSVRMVFGNFKELLRISLVPVLICVVMLTAAFLLIEDQIGAPYDLSTGPAATSGVLFFMFAALFGGGFVSLWIIVNWHRFILLEEFPQGWVPPMYFDRILSYIGHALLLVLLFVVAALPVAGVIGLLGTTPLATFVAFVFWVGAVLILWRVIIILPAAAIGQPIKLRAAWEATQGAWGTIAVLLIVSVLFQFVIQLLFAALQYLMPVIGTFLILIPSVFVLPLINVSILTTMYGVFVEARSLD